MRVDFALLTSAFGKFYNSMDTELKAGCLHEGKFYPAEEGIAYGYWCNNTFLDLKDPSFDFDGLPATAQPCGYFQSLPKLLAPGAKPGFMFRSRFYLSTKEILIASMTQPSAHRLSATLSNKLCALCKRMRADWLYVQGKEVCIDCLVGRLRTNKLYFEERNGIVNWSAEVIYKVHKGVREAGRSMEIPTQCPLPLDTVICCGFTEQIDGNYPTYGHFVGVGNQCAEGSCLNHVLCFKCADICTNCPICNAFISYELPPQKCKECQEPLCYGFDVACRNCGHIPKRRKQTTEH